MRIAILGWGSLLWDKRPEFDDHHHAWENNGPNLKIEFSRVSKSRQGALTLVIDPTNGTDCTVAYTMSKRKDPEDAICDLRCREGTTRSNIGFYVADGSRSQSRYPATLVSVRKWAGANSIDAVVWTDLESNFQKRCNQHFAVKTALKWLCQLPEDAKAGAAQYIWRAPDFVKTPLRATLETEPWFKSAKTNLSG